MNQHCSETEAPRAEPQTPAEPSTGPNVLLKDAAHGAQAPLDAFAERFELALQRGVEHLAGLFERKLAYDATKQQQVDRLHEELMQHRSGLVARTSRPLVNGVIRLHDDIGKLIQSLRGKSVEALPAEKVFTLLQEIQDDIEIILGQNGTSAYREQGSVFNPRRQRVVRRVATPDPALDGKVADRLGPGFESGHELIEKERITLYLLEVHPPAEVIQAPPLSSPHPPTPSVATAESES